VLNDLIDWKICGHVFDAMPTWIHQVSRHKGLWAPESPFSQVNITVLCVFRVGSNVSGIALATNETLDPKPEIPLEDEGWC